MRRLIPLAARQIRPGFVIHLYGNYELIAARKLGKVAVENAAQEFLRGYPGVESVYTRTQLETGQLPHTKLSRHSPSGPSDEAPTRA